jgi:hypothetical protein
MLCGFEASCEKEPHTKPPRHKDTKKARRMNVIAVNNALWPYGLQLIPGLPAEEGAVNPVLKRHDADQIA